MWNLKNKVKHKEQMVTMAGDSEIGEGDKEVKSSNYKVI